MNYMDILKEYRQKYQDCDTDLAYLNRLAVVKFERDERNNISGRCRFGLVYRHRDSESMINEGETWVCELEENYKANAQYFGKGVMKVDSSFIFDLRQDQMKLIAETMWAEHRDYYESFLDEKYAESIEARAEEKAKEAMSELKQTVDIKENQIELLRGKIKKLTADIEDRDVMISSMRNSRSSTGHAPFPVRRICADTLYSENFSGRYDVRFSADGKKIAIIPDDDGRIESSDKMIRLPCMNDLLPFYKPEAFPAEIDDNGTITVSM